MKTTLALVLLALTSFTHAQAEDEINFDDAIALEPIADSAPQAHTGTASCIERHNCYLLSDSAPMYRLVDPSESVRLLGKGVQGKRSKQNMTLACVGADHSCDQLQFIYYVNPQELYYVGPKFKVSSSADLKKALKRLSKESRPGHSQVVGGLTIFGALGACFALAPVVGTTPFLVLFGGLFIAWKSLGSNRAGEPFDVVRQFKEMTNNDDGVQLTNQNGWNWSGDARKVSEKKFAAMVQYLQFANGFFYDNKSSVQVVR